MKLDKYGDAAKELDKIRRSAQKAVNQEGKNQEVIQLLYDFRDNVLIFKVAR
jgi:hypothetical protein